MTAPLGEKVTVIYEPTLASIDVGCSGKSQHVATPTLNQRLASYIVENVASVATC